MEKAQARKCARESICRLTLEERNAKSEAIRLRLCALPELCSARVVMGFLSLPDEVDTKRILQYLLDEGKEVYVPRTLWAERKLLPVRFRGMSYVKAGPLEILEPDTTEACASETLDIILVPGRAFDRNGNRVGRGGGFYDRFMADKRLRATRCGLAFSCQILPVIPSGETDLPIDLLVTEAETLRFAD